MVANRKILTLYPPRHFRIIELNGGQPPLTYKRYQTLISRMDPPEMPVETLSNTIMGGCVTPVSEDHGDKYGVPSLEELGELKRALSIEFKGIVHFFSSFTLLSQTCMNLNTKENVEECW